MSTTDITKPADLTAHAEGTGPLRKQRPLYVDFMPPCNSQQHISDPTGNERANYIKILESQK